MRKLLPLSAQSFCAVLGVLVVVMTAVFVLVPYALEGHPWESGRDVASAAGAHPT